MLLLGKRTSLLPGLPAALVLLACLAFPGVASARPASGLSQWFLCLWGTWTDQASLTATCAPEGLRTAPSGLPAATPEGDESSLIDPHGSSDKEGPIIDPDGLPAASPEGDEGVLIDPHG